MSSFNYLWQKNKFLLILLGVGFLMLLVTVIVSLSVPESEAPATSPRPSATILRSLPNFPPAQPQEYNNQDSKEQANLSITANIEGVNVTIDQEEVESSEFFAPTNTTPFVISKMPIGKHILRASKLGFLNQALTVELKPNQIAEINIQMQPDPDFNALEEAIKEMPISTGEYFIEYLDKIGKIQVIIRKAPFETYKQTAINWFKERGIADPEKSGILFYPAVNIDQ